MKKNILSLVLLLFVNVSSIGVYAQSAISTTPSTTYFNCNGTATVNPSLIGPYWTWNQGTVLLQTGGVSIVGLCPGSYELQYTNNGNNPNNPNPNSYVIISFTIILGSTDPCSNSNLQAILTSTTGTTTAIATNTCNNSITINASGGVAPYQFMLNDDASQTTNVFNNLCPDNYYLVVTDAQGCTYNSSIVIQADTTNPCENSTLQANYEATPVTAAGTCDGFITVDASGGVAPYQFMLNGGINQTTNTFNSLCADYYYLTVTDSLGCMAYTSIDIHNYSTTNPCDYTSLQIYYDVTPVSNADTCDGSITAYAYGGVAPYQFMLNDSLSPADNTFNNLCADYYYLKVTDSLGCMSYTSVIIQQDTINPCQNSTLYANFEVTPVTDATTCDGSITVNAFGGIAPYQFKLNDSLSQSTNVFTNLCPDYYNLVVTDSLGCTFFSTVFIQMDTINPCTNSTLFATMNTINATTSNSCDGIVHVMASGGMPPYMFSDDMGSTFVNFNTFSNICVGDHLFMVKDQIGCSAIVSGTIYVDTTNSPCANSQLSVVLDGTNVTSPMNCDGTLSAVVSGYGTGFTYEWSNNLGSSSLNLENLCPGMYSITVESEGCTVTMSKNVEINATSTGCTGSTLSGIISGTNATDISTCNGSIIISGNGGTAPYQYSIDDGITIGSTPEFIDLCAGQYYVGLADAEGCVLHFIHYVGIDSISISNPCENSSISVVLTPTPVSSSTVCDGTITAMVTGGIAPITPIWSAGSNASANTLTLTDLCSDIYTLYVVDANGCTMTSSAYVGGFIDSTVAANMGINGYVIPVDASGADYCDGNASVIVYGGVQPFTYLYSNGATTSNAVGLCAGLHSVVVTDDIGSTMTFDFIIGSPANSTVTDSYIDSTIVDSVYTEPIIDCFVNFAMIDSAFITGFYILPNDSIIVNWGVVFNDSMIIVTNTYGLTIGGATAAAGVYMITLQLYCPDKATGNFLSATDQIYYSQQNENDGINENIGNSVSIYPNPFNDHISISLENPEGCQIIISDITGKVIIDEKFTDNLITIDMSSLSPGQYLVNVKNDSLNFTRKIIK